MRANVPGIKRKGKRVAICDLHGVEFTFVEPFDAWWALHYNFFHGKFPHVLREVAGTAFEYGFECGKKEAQA